MRTFDFTNPAQVEHAQIADRQRLAELLMAQATAPMPVYSDKAGLARLIAGALSGHQMQGARKDERALAERQQGARAAEMDSIMETAQGGDRTALARLLARSGDPRLQEMGLSMAMQQPAKEESFTLGPGQRRFRGSEVVAEVPAEEKPQGPKRGDRRDRFDGPNLIQEEWDGQQWSPFGRGPRFNDRPAAVVNVNGPKENFKNEKTLRDEFTEASKPFTKIRDAYSQVRDTLSGDITAPATLAGATKFMKMLDPESVVRESELQMALKSTGMLDRFMNLHNTIAKGQVLTPAQAKEIQRIAGTLYQTAEAQQKRVGDYYSRLAREYELDPARVVREMWQSGAPSAAGGWSIKPIP